jgi:hypothetical protein
VPVFAALAVASRPCFVKTSAAAVEAVVLSAAVAPVAAVYEDVADVCLDTAVAKRVDAEVTPLLAVAVAVAKVVWAARACASATDRVANKAELAVLVTARRDAAVDAAAAVVEIAATVLEAVELIREAV